MNIYSLCDLDDFFWDYTTWYVAKDNDEIQSLILSYADFYRRFRRCFQNGKFTGFDLSPAAAQVLRVLEHRTQQRFKRRISSGAAWTSLQNGHGKIGISKIERG